MKTSGMTKWLAGVTLCCLWGSLMCPAVSADTATYCQVAGSSCLSFDGTDDYVNLGNNTSIRVTGNMSVGAWVQLDPSNTGQYWGIVGKLSSSGGGVTGATAWFGTAPTPSGS